MNKINAHTFHIPVMGLAYTIDSPIRVAQYGISSVISITDDEVIEKMRAIYSENLSNLIKKLHKSLTIIELKELLII